MPERLEADVALIHIAGGDARITPPPGTLAQTAPRRSARGRADDMLFLTVSVQTVRSIPAGLLEHLARMAAEAYFGTPGTVTAALREASAAINDHLLSANQGQAESMQFEGRFLAAVLREGDVYLAQSGPGQAVLIRPGQLTRLTSEEASGRPLGLTVSPFVRYFHFEGRARDLILLTTWAPPVWSDPTLSGLAELETAQAVERLVAAAGQDLTGVLARLLPATGAAPALAAAAPEAPPRAARPSTRPAPRGQTGEGRSLRSIPTPTMRVVRRVARFLGRPFAAIASWIGGMLPGWTESPSPGTFPPSLLAGTAIAVPLMVVAVVSVLYFRRGRVQQFEEFLLQAQAAVVSAQLKPSAEEARADWLVARHWLEQAEAYGRSDDSQALRAQVDGVLDELDHVRRVEFIAAVSGGVGPGARVTAMAATPTDVYMLDDTRDRILHGWFTGRGFEIDRDFGCMEALGGTADLDPLVDLLIQPEPGALGAEGVVGVDQDGTLVYCAPGKAPASGQLDPPGTGWGRIQAIDLLGDNLYVLDPKANAVWIYAAVDGLYAGIPVFYFAESVQSLNRAVDMAVTQDELFLLFDDGTLDRCRRLEENAPDGSLRIRVECEQGLSLFPSGTAIPGGGEVFPVEMVYAPPPEASLFVLDGPTSSVFQFSMRLVYQARFVPTPSLPDEVGDLAVGRTHDLYLAAGDQLYFLQRSP
ncbi:MAG TPA: hypothetical protein VFI11_14750 [Anaerolineales bacterium]|nr:hypothetical protein [Anaerolineales bacterium]